MTKFKMPRQLKMNPQDFDIELKITETPETADDLPVVYFKCGETSGDIIVTSKEAKQISRWFARLAEAIK